MKVGLIVPGRSDRRTIPGEDRSDIVGSQM